MSNYQAHIYGKQHGRNAMYCGVFAGVTPAEWQLYAMARSYANQNNIPEYAQAEYIRGYVSNWR